MHKILRIVLSGLIVFTILNCKAQNNITGISKYYYNIETIWYGGFYLNSLNNNFIIGQGKYCYDTNIINRTFSIEEGALKQIGKIRESLDYSNSYYDTNMTPINSLLIEIAPRNIVIGNDKSWFADFYYDYDRDKIQEKIHLSGYSDYYPNGVFWDTYFSFGIEIYELDSNSYKLIQTVEFPDSIQEGSFIELRTKPSIGFLNYPGLECDILVLKINRVSKTDNKAICDYYNYELLFFEPVLTGADIEFIDIETLDNKEIINNNDK